MLKLTYKSYVIYFTSKCLVEPIHLHVNSPIPCEKGSAKIWIGPDGQYKVADYGKFKKPELYTLYKEFISHNLPEFETNWRTSSGMEVIIYHRDFESKTHFF